MESGKLRQRITFQSNTPTANSLGEYVDTWADYCTVWAAVEPLSGNRYFAAQQANSEVAGVVRIRYRSGIEPTMRIVFGERILKIISIIIPDERNREIHILFKEGLD